MTTNWKLYIIIVGISFLFAFNQRDVEKEFFVHASSKMIG